MRLLYYNAEMFEICWNSRNSIKIMKNHPLEIILSLRMGHFCSCLHKSKSRSLCFNLKMHPKHSYPPREICFYQARHAYFCVVLCPGDAHYVYTNTRSCPLVSPCALRSRDQELSNGIWHPCIAKCPFHKAVFMSHAVHIAGTWWARTSV